MRKAHISGSYDAVAETKKGTSQSVVNRDMAALKKDVARHNAALNLTGFRFPTSIRANLDK